MIKKGRAVGTTLAMVILPSLFRILPFHPILIPLYQKSQGNPLSWSFHSEI